MHSQLDILRKSIALGSPARWRRKPLARLIGQTLTGMGLGALLLGQAHAASVAIIDSGVDNEHERLLPQIWMNPGETIGNGRDDDWNAYVDDVFGWNFAEQNNLVIDRSFLGSFSEFPYRFFELQEKLLLGTITTAEQEWMRDSLNVPANLQELQRFGNFVHGTHVAGIVQAQSPAAEILALKIIPTVVKPPFQRNVSLVLETARDQGLKLPLSNQVASAVRERVIKGLLFALARAQGLIMNDVGKYLHRQKVDVANGSFGVSVRTAQGVVKPLLQVLLGRAPSDDEVLTYARHFVNQVVIAQGGLVDASKDTLFVFAAGNDGANNDVDSTSPANIKRDNTLAVAATMATGELAGFSNYGVAMVDVAAPGVAIRSAAPGNTDLVLSGTSQAAPFVAGVAAQIRSLNPELSPAETKGILIGTVDKLPSLADKVTSGGMVNAERALRAAELSLKMPLLDAVERALTDVPQTSRTRLFSETHVRFQRDALKVLDLPTGFE